jgi:hypothetical protein
VNGLPQHTEELKIFISVHNIDVMLISETHFTEKSYLKLPNHTVYHTNHPARTAQSRTARIKKEFHQASPKNYNQDFLQATSVSVEDSVSLLNFGCLSSTQTYSIARAINFYNTVGHQFIGDYNATGDPDSLHPEDVKYSKRWKETT